MKDIFFHLVCGLVPSELSACLPEPGSPGEESWISPLSVASVSQEGIIGVIKTLLSIHLQHHVIEHTQPNIIN